MTQPNTKSPTCAGDDAGQAGLDQPLAGEDVRLHGLVSALPAATYITDRLGRITHYNEAAVELWGRRPALGEESWCGSFRIFRPDGAPMPLDECPMAVALRDGREVRGAEILIERPDGLRRHVMPHPKLLRDAAGEVVGAVNMLIDLTEQKRCEALIRATDARSRAMLAATPECVKLVAPDGTVLEINAVGLGMIEAAGAEDVIGRSVYDIVAQEDREAFRAFNERVCRGEAGSLAFDLIGLRGTRRHMESSAVPLADANGRFNHLAVTRDVTDRLGADQVRRHLAAIVESSDDAIISKNIDGIIMSWNRGAERVLGYTAEEAIGRHISLIIPPERTDDSVHILAQIRRGERVDHYETKRRAKDGRILDISLTVSPVRDASGKIVGASKVARDITDRRRAEEAVREANRRKDEFLAMLAHELRNPLAAIGNAVRVAREGELDEPLRWSTEIIERQVRHLARLIDDLLDVSRINRGKIQLREDVVDIGPILYGAVEAVRPLVEERKHKLDVSFGPGVLRVKADPIRLEQVVVNLLGNAAKYMESGGHIWLTGERDGSDVAIRVRDTGIGIPPEKLPQMFELFVQGDRTLARSEGGLGIGLTLVKSLVEMHGGTITATSEGPGRGCEFVVRLLAVARPRAEPARPVAPASRVKQAARILIVDDNDDSARGLARLLRLLGHDIRTAHDGPEAVAIALQDPPDVVLLDIGLPGMDGYQVASELRKHEACRSALIIAVSGYGQDDDRRRSRESGFDHHLVKPIDHDALLTLLNAN